MEKFVILDIETAATTRTVIESTFIKHLVLLIRAFVKQHPNDVAVQYALTAALQEKLPVDQRPDIPKTLNEAWLAKALPFIEMIATEKRDHTSVRTLVGLFVANGFAGGKSLCPVSKQLPSRLKTWNDQGYNVVSLTPLPADFQRFLFARTNYGDLRQHFSRYIDERQKIYGSGKNALATLPTTLRTEPEQIIYVTADPNKAADAESYGYYVELRQP